MMWHTHWMIGLNSLWLLAPVLHNGQLESFAPLVLAASLGSLLPDLDAAESKIKHLRLGQIKPFFIPAQMVHKTDVHRGMLHSLVGLGMIAIMGVPMAILAGGTVWLALLLGYTSHLAADALTKSGVALLYPRRTRYYLLPVGWRFATGSQDEEVIFVVTALLSFALFLQFTT